MTMCIENQNCCNLKMPGAYNKMLKNDQRQKSLKILLVILADTESGLEKYPYEVTIQRNRSHKKYSVWLFIHTLLIWQQQTQT